MDTCAVEINKTQLLPPELTVEREANTSVSHEHNVIKSHPKDAGG